MPLSRVYSNMFVSGSLLESYKYEYPIAYRVSNRICILDSVLTFDDEFGGRFYGTGRSSSAAGEGAGVLLVGGCYE